MKNIFKYFIIIVFSVSFFGCKKDLLELKPKEILLEEQVWNDETMIRSLLADFYSRIPVHSQINSGELNFAAYDEALTPGAEYSAQAFRPFSDESVNNIVSYAYNRWTLWNYDYIRDINLALEGIAKFSTKLDPTLKSQFTAEFRFLRAYNYFELVKRMGGVPIITTQLIYDYSGDPSYLAKPRDSEAAVYDFIASELDDIKESLGNITSQSRANKFAALALKCRAMLYAGSIAKYNNLMPAPITLPGGEVGIPASRAASYYQASLDAAKEIISSGKYLLYNKNPNLGENFFEAFVKKVNNPEVILAQDFLTSKGINHGWPYEVIARTVREDNLCSSGLSPNLSLVEAYEYLDGSPGTLKGVGTGSNTAAGQTNWIFYSKIEDIFANKDARLYGTIVYPGTTLKGQSVDIQAGVYVWNAAANKYDRIESGTLGTMYTDGKLLTGLGGPMRNMQEVSNSGFYVRKYIDPAPLTSARGVGSDVWWIRFRYGEVLLNAAEAAFELGLPEALTYVNQVRERAGFPPNSLNAGTLTLAELQNERRIELAFEDHRVWDLMRWRIAHVLWNGSPVTPSANIFALYPYRVIDPVHPERDGKYVFDSFIAPKFKAPRFFQMGNYYSQISQNVLDANPLIIKNPFH